IRTPRDPACSNRWGLVHLRLTFRLETLGSQCPSPPAPKTLRVCGAHGLRAWSAVYPRVADDDRLRPAWPDSAAPSPVGRAPWRQRLRASRRAGRLRRGAGGASRRPPGHVAGWRARSFSWLAYWYTWITSTQGVSTRPDTISAGSITVLLRRSPV